MLDIGLHSYGFTDAAFFWLCVFIISQLLIIGLGFVRLLRRLEEEGERSSSLAKRPSTPEKQILHSSLLRSGVVRQREMGVPLD